MPFGTTFDIPSEIWSSTDMVQSETKRARSRRIVRQTAKEQWRALKRAGAAHRCERFVAAIGVAYPRMSDVTPSYAAETVKPIIDAGTDVRLWPDDDATHRCCTIYYQLPEPAPRGHYLLNVMILPVPAKRPAYQPTTAIARGVLKAWGDVPEGERPEGYRGYRSVNASVPNRLWITSNFTDSDLLARQHGAHKSRKWGDPKALGVRGRVGGRLETLMEDAWTRTPHWPLERYTVLAGVAYPHGVGNDDADPDNAAETVNIMLEAGMSPKVAAWPGIDGRRCKAVGFYRWPFDCPGGTHEIHLAVLPVPEAGFHILTALKSSWADAWDDHARMRG